MNRAGHQDPPTQDETVGSVAAWAERHGYAPRSDIDVATRIRGHVGAARHQARTMMFAPAGACLTLVADALVLSAVLAARWKATLTLDAPAGRDVPAGAPLAQAMDFGGNIFDLLGNAAARDLPTQALRLGEAAAALKAIVIYLASTPQAAVNAHMAALRKATNDPLRPGPDRGAMALAVISAAGVLLDEVQRQARQLSGRPRLAHVARRQVVIIRINGGVVLDTSAALSKLQEALS